MLDATETVVREELRLASDGNGNRCIVKGSRVIATETDSDYARTCRFAFGAAPLAGKRIAWIGGGLCLGPRLFVMLGVDQQVVFEIEPSLAQFAIEYAEFIPGDWRVTLTGTFDVILYDIGDTVPYEELTKHLNPGGVILPMETP